MVRATAADPAHALGDGLRRGLGSTLFPWLLGRLAGASGTAALPGALALTALGVVGAALALRLAVRRTVLAPA